MSPSADISESKINLYLVEMVVDDLKIFGSAGDEDTSRKVVQLCMNDEVFIEIYDHEFGGNINYEMKGKNCIFSLGRNFDNMTLKYCAYKVNDDNSKELIGAYSTSAKPVFDKITKKYDANSQRSKLPSQDKSYNRSQDQSLQTLYSFPGGVIQQPIGGKTTSETFRNMYPLLDLENISRGYITPTVRMSCFGPRVSQTMNQNMPKVRGATSNKECAMLNNIPDCSRFLTPASGKEKDCCPPPPSTPPRSVCSGAEADDSYNEYKAEVNGNSLTVKITNSYQLVTNVYDNKKDGCASKKLNYTSDGKKMKFEIPTNSRDANGGACQPKLMCQLPPMVCQRVGSKPKNRQKSSQTTCCVCNVPVIKGNRKYPASISLERKPSPRCLTGPRPPQCSCPCPCPCPQRCTPERNICIQCTSNDIDEKAAEQAAAAEAAAAAALAAEGGIDGAEVVPQPTSSQMPVPSTGSDLMKPQPPHGIEVCKKGWHDMNTESYVLKIAKCKKGGKGNEKGVDFEIRVPKGPVCDPPRKETRGIQVMEDEFPKATPSGGKEASAANLSGSKGGKKGKGKGKKK